MGDFQVWFAMHAQTTLLIGKVCLLVGLLLLVIRWLLRLSVRRHTISARNGGVVVGRDNSGTIITGGISGDKTSGSVDRLVVVTSWVTIIGLPMTLVGILLTFLAWQFPVQP